MVSTPCCLPVPFASPARPLPSHLKVVPVTKMKAKPTRHLVEQLRQLMAERGLDAYYVPSADPHMVASPPPLLQGGSVVQQPTAGVYGQHGFRSAVATDRELFVSFSLNSFPRHLVPSMDFGGGGLELLPVATTLSMSTTRPHPRSEDSFCSMARFSVRRESAGLKKGCRQ